MGPACWLWDYMRKSGASGYFVPLSGGLDSAACALLVFSMCRLLCKEIAISGNVEMTNALKRLLGVESIPADPRDLCGYNPPPPHFPSRLILHTTYLQTNNSSPQSHARAQALAEAISSYHMTVNIEEVAQSVKDVLGRATGFTPRHLAAGGTVQESLSLQNLQARLRLTMSYYCSQVLPMIRNKPNYILVVGTANCDEA
jgi:NAD+ synthase (glutamine-hydrolysing)